MQSRILVRPNLKLIVLGALLIAVLHHVVTSGKSEPSFLRDPQYRATWLGDEDLAQLIDAVEANPSAPGYMLISQVYEKRRDIRKALHYIKKADIIAGFEEAEE